MSTSVTTPTTKPKHGDSHPIYGIYLGGSALDATYKLMSDNTFHHVSQVCSVKQANSSETTLISNMEDNKKIKFNGNLEVTSCSLTEYDKDGFLQAVKEKVKYYGLHNFFYLPDVSKTMKYLLDFPHDFMLEEVTKEYKARVKTPDPVNDDAGTETPASKLARFEAYNVYELSYQSLSRLCVESLQSTLFRERILNRFSHLPDFENLPGQIYLMMAFDTCLASASVDVDGVVKQFNGLALTSFPGEDIASFAVTALKLFKIMCTAYAMDVKTGSKLLCKVQATQCEFEAILASFLYGLRGSRLVFMRRT